MDNWEKKLIQKIRQAIGRPDDRANFPSIETMLGIPDAANSNIDDILRTGFDSSTTTTNDDGSILERTEGIRNQLKSLGYIGDVFFADSAKADDTGDGFTPETAKKTIDAAVNLCSTNHGDIIVVFASNGATFDENANTGGILLDISQIALVGINYPQILNSNGAGTAVITLSGNNCLVTGLYTNETSFGSIYCTGAFNKIFSNIIHGDSGHGVHIDGGDTNEVFNNFLKNMGQATIAGVAIENDANENRIFDNVVYNADYGISVISAACDGNQIFHNIIAGAGGGTARGISIAAGSHTTVASNYMGQCVAAIIDSGTNTILTDNHEVSYYTRAGDVPLTFESELSKWSKFFADGDGDGATGTQLASNKSLVDALGTNGTTVADSAVSVLGAIGANNANNAFDSSTVTSNVDGSVLERLEAISSGVIVGTGTFTTDSSTVPADTGQGAKASNYFRGCLLIPLTGSCAFQPRLITSFTTGTGVYALDADEPFTATPGLVTYVIVAAETDLTPTVDVAYNTTTSHVIGNKADAIPAMNLAPGADSIVAQLKAILERVGATPADPDDSLLTTIGQRDDSVTVASTATIISLLRDLIAGLSVVASGAGTGFEIDGTPSLVSALGTTGATVTDSATSVLGAIGANNADNAFDSSSVVENGDGSTLERLEELRGKTDTTGSPFTLTAAMTTVEQTVLNYTPTKNGRIAAEFDLQTLIDDGYVGNITIRLKFMIDGVNLRVIDRVDFMVGTDEIMPTVNGYVVEGASFVRLTIQANVAVDDVPAKTIPYRIIES